MFRIIRIVRYLTIEIDETIPVDTGTEETKKPDMDDYEPCDKKATLYVMQQEIEGQTYNTSE